MLLAPGKTGRTGRKNGFKMRPFGEYRLINAQVFCHFSKRSASGKLQHVTSNKPISGILHIVFSCAPTCTVDHTKLVLSGFGGLSYVKIHLLEKHLLILFVLLHGLLTIITIILTMHNKDFCYYGVFSLTTDFCVCSWINIFLWK